MVSLISSIESFIYRKTPSFFPSKSYEPDHSIIVPSFDEGVEFFSKFENGNLDKAIRISKSEYELYLSEDYNTSGHYHWFYFKTTSTLPKNTEVTFTIVNMIKPSSLYSVGFRPFAYSAKKNEGWMPAGDSISYTPNKPLIGDTTKRKYYSLKWHYIYEFDNDEVYFVQFIPYSYTDLLNYLREIKNEKNKAILRIDILCKTLAKNVCPILTITDNVKNYLPYRYEKEMTAKSRNTKKILLTKVEKLYSKSIAKKNNEGESLKLPEVRAHELEVALAEHRRDHGNKKGIIITARVHPGIY